MAGDSRYRWCPGRVGVMNRLVNLVYRRPLVVVLCFALAFVAAGFVHARYGYFDFPHRVGRA